MTATNPFPYPNLDHLISHPLIMLMHPTRPSNRILLTQLPRPPLQLLRIPGIIPGLIRAGDNPRRITKQIIHLLERQLLRLGQNSPEEQRIREIANHKQDVEFPGHGRHGDGRDLADHRVEGEAGHGGEGDALGARARVEDFGGDDP